MDDVAIGERPQIQSRTISKWRGVLPAAQIARFEESYGDLIRTLGYEPAGAAHSHLENKHVSACAIHVRTSPAAAGDAVKPIGSRPEQRPKERGHTPAVGKITRDAGIRLSADGAAIRPTAISQGTYSFVVSSGRRRVRLESRFGIPVDPSAPNLSDISRLGVRVSEIAIRSDAGEVVIAADDPRLTTGWHDAEHAGTTWWRWTDGSAELPWVGVSGPAVVTVRCGTLAEYSIDDEEFGH
jgi:hypothetical protein